MKIIKIINIMFTNIIQLFLLLKKFTDNTINQYL